MHDQPLDFLLRVRDRRRGRDRFPEKVFLAAALGWVALSLIAILAGADPLECFRVLAATLLFPVSCVYAFGLPLRQLQRDASLHASFYGGNCYPEILGTLLRPREILDQVAAHSLRAGMASASPWVILVALLGMALYPACAGPILAVLALWFPLAALFLWSTAYLAQQFSIYNSQLKGGLVGSLSDSLVAVTTAVPVLVCAIVGITALATGHYDLAGGAFLAYALLMPLICRLLGIAGIERLPQLRQKVQQMGRKLLGVRRNRWVPIWSDNPVVVRERRRDAGRIPGGLLGAVLFQLPLFVIGTLSTPTLAPLLVGPWAVARAGANFLFGVLVLLGAIQAIRAGNRCSGAIVGEIENKTLESMQNTRLHAREYARGWLEVAAVPRVVENLLLLAPILYLGWKELDLAGVAALGIFVLSPLVGACIGLYASLATNREKSARRYSEVMTMAAGVWFGVWCLGMVAAPQVLQGLWVPLFLPYMGVVGWMCWHQVVSRIEV